MLAALRAGHSLVVSQRDTATLCETIEAAANKHALPFLLRFVPIGCNGQRALPVESIAMSAVGVLHMVHEGFFGALRCREAAIEAVQACGSLPVPSIGVGPVAHRAPLALTEHHVDRLIDREAELHAHQTSTRRPRARA